jgi:putative (di)nucleoside polyphosphate hydrolase
MVVNKDGMVFVARRIDTAEDAWQLPQGGVDAGEQPEDAVLREVEEEIGTRKVKILAAARNWHSYDLPPGLADRVWGGRYRGQRQMWFALRFNGVDSDIDLNASGHPEFDAWRWVPIQDLPTLAIFFKRQIYADLVSEFGAVVASSISR